MTKARNFKRTYMAITLCIIIVLISACSFVCVADTSGESTQFFAARLYLMFAPPLSATLSGSGGLKIVSWIRKQDANTETDSAAFGAKSPCFCFADKPVSYRVCKPNDTYAEHKSVRCVLRI